MRLQNLAPHLWRILNLRTIIQVAYEITDKNREREFGNFSFIKDNYPKYVISRDQV